MKCLECNNELSYIDHKRAMELFGLELCAKHNERMEKLMRRNGTPLEAVQLYYGLKTAGANPMLEWWDGTRSVDIAISRVKLNIEIDCEYQMLSYEQAMNELEETMHSYKNGFTTIQIPHMLVKHYLQETVANILGIIKDLRISIKVV